MKKQSIALIGVPLAIAVFFCGWWVGRPGARSTKPAVAAAANAKFWTCAMHPQFQLPGPGLCPICAMELIPVYEDANDMLGPRQIRLSARAIELAEVELAPVTRRLPTVTVRMAGKVDYAETRLTHVSARFPGRLDRLYVDYTGVPVRKGDHMVYIYSPALLTAQEELLQALKTGNELRRSDQALILERAGQTVEAGREKLRLWGLTAEQISEIEERGKLSDHLTLYAPVSGIVIDKSAVEGMYVETGTRIYTIADLSQVWVKLDAYESDLSWIHYGQDVEFQTQAYSGETFHGQIAFIDPTLDPKTRTVKVRVNVDNAGGRLKPEMFVSAVVSSRVAQGGKVLDPGLSGKWISPMHPEIIKDGPGTCDVCGMDLVSAESLGYVTAGAALTNTPMLVPASAPLITGKRAVVYLALTNGVFEGREIVLGPRAGDEYIVESGLEEGDLVVVRGNFKIDSAVQIQAKPSMMSAPDGRGPPAHHGHDHDLQTTGEALDLPEASSEQLAELYGAYLKLQETLAADQAEAAKEAAATVLLATEALSGDELEGATLARWTPAHLRLVDSVSELEGASDLERLRAAFEPLSEAMLALFKTFKVPSVPGAYVIRCPMAFDNRGARWLQATPDIRNPYFGAKMRSCGKVLEEVNTGARDE